MNACAKALLKEAVIGKSLIDSGGFLVLFSTGLLVWQGPGSDLAFAIVDYCCKSFGSDPEFSSRPRCPQSRLSKLSLIVLS